MLVGKDTGYEGKFDFPRRADPPSQAYLLASLPRSGSSWFSHLLWSTGCLGAPLEYLNFESAGPYYFAAASPAVQARLWQSALVRRTSPNGIFGLKCFASQLEALRAGNPALLAEVMDLMVRNPGARIVYFERRDRLAQAISYARASLSGIWRKEQETGGGIAIEYSEIAIERVLQLIESEQAAWRQMLAELGLSPLTIAFEDALADPESAIGKVADYLGVTLEPSARVTIPSVEKQATGDSRAWAERYAAGEGSR